MRRARARWRRPTAPRGPASAEAPIRAAEPISRRCAASTAGSGSTPVSVNAGQYDGGVDGLLAAFAMTEQHGESAAGGDVQPVQPTGHAQPGLIGVRQWGLGERGAGG